MQEETMSGETQQSVSGWTVDTLRQYVDQRMVDQEKAMEKAFVAQEKAVASAFEASNTAIVKSEMASEKRFESVNEFRQTLSDQAASFLPRAEADRVTTSNAEKIQSLADRLNRIEAQDAGSKITMGKMFAMLAAGGTILSIVIVLANQFANSTVAAKIIQPSSVLAPPK